MSVFQLKTLVVWYSTLSLAAQSQTVEWSSVRELDLSVSHLEIQGEQLEKQQAKHVFKQLCHQAKIVLRGYKVGHCRH